MNTSKLLTGILIVLAIVFATLYFTKSVQNPQPIQVGSVSGPDLYSPYFNVNNVINWYTRQGLYQASTTVCALKSPAATSTLSRVGLIESVSSSTASYIDIGYSSNPTATTTILGGGTIAANAQVAMSISSSTIISPNMYVVINQKGPTSQIANPTGFCEGIFTQL